MKMPRFIAPLFCALLLLANTSKALDAGVSFAVYATPDKPYIEVNLEIAALSLTWQTTADSTLRAGVDVLLMIKQGEKVINFEQYRLNSPAVWSPRSLLDVRRLAVPNGEYTLEIEIADLNAPANKTTFKSPLVVAVGTGLHLSELQLLRRYKPDASESPFVKNGILLEPLPFNFYEKEIEKLSFYAEVYHADRSISDETYLLRYFVESDKGAGKFELVSAGSQKKKPVSIDAVLAQIDIRDLKSGNYRLTVELRNRANELLALRRLDFQRSNPFLQLNEHEITDEILQKEFVQELSEANLRYSLRALNPMVYGDDSETLKNVLKGDNLRAMRFYLFRYFVQKDPNNPRQAYLSYMEAAGAVHEKFQSGFRYGFETDRGRMFLRYGKPDDLVHVEDDPSAPPYEIWVYYNFPKTNQKNVKFLFYNPTLAGEDFILLHSNARGEINNPRWERDLYQRNAGNQQEGDNFHDSQNMKRNVNRYARVYFEDF
jgi:GWxTD domain-containing protein